MAAFAVEIFLRVRFFEIVTAFALEIVLDFLEVVELPSSEFSMLTGREVLAVD